MRPRILAPGTAARRQLPALVLIALSASLLGAGRAAADPRTPTNPSRHQVAAAADQRNSAAAEVGRISGRIALAQTEIDRYDNDAELAEQKLALARQRQQQAKTAAAVAAQQVARARGQVAAAHARFVLYVQQTYMYGGAAESAGSLLTAGDPESLIDQADLRGYAAARRAEAVGQLQAATVARSNAAAAATRGYERRSQAAAAARRAQEDVVRALALVETRRAALRDQLARERRLLQSAEMAVTGLRNQRAAYLAWTKRQQQVAAREAARKRTERLAQQRAAAAAQQAEEKSADSRSTTPGPRSGARSRDGAWTPATGRRAAARAKAYVGTPYSWAGGDAGGPTYGVSESGSAWNDSRIIGFDCSGLTLYAWAPWVPMDHYAATQYTQAGRYHPTINRLMPGDLVFWSGDGTIAGIGHEGIYLGHGDVIQAPESGDVVKITNIFDVESGYFGATRPLTR